MINFVGIRPWLYAMWAKEGTSFILEFEDRLKPTKQTIQSVPGGLPRMWREVARSWTLSAIYCRNSDASSSNGTLHNVFILYIYKSEGPGIDPRSLGIFSGASDSSMRPGVDSASKNENQDIPGGKDGRCVRLTTLPPSCAECLEILEP